MEASGECAPGGALVSGLLFLSSAWWAPEGDKLCSPKVITPSPHSLLTKNWCLPNQSQTNPFSSSSCLLWCFVNDAKLMDIVRSYNFIHFKECSSVTVWLLTCTQSVTIRNIPYLLPLCFLINCLFRYLYCVGFLLVELWVLYLLLIGIFLLTDIIFVWFPFHWLVLASLYKTNYLYLHGYICRLWFFCWFI